MINNFDHGDSGVSASRALDRIAGLADEWKLTGLRPQIAASRQLLESHNGIDVAVLGRFKAGKSSFLNHLVGRPVLPVGVVPLTAVITRLRHGDRERAEVRFLDGARREIALSEIGEYVGEQQNPRNRKNVAAVEVELPELKSLAPLQFVDTPGLGSALAHNTQAAMDWLPNVGAALVAVSSDAPLSERDVALIAELRRHTPKIALLLTKADLLSEAQRAEVREFVASQLNGGHFAATGEAAVAEAPAIKDRKSNVPLPVYFYSIKPGGSALQKALAQELLEPLRARRGEAGGEILQHKLASLRAQVLGYLRVALAAATQAESARAALREKLADERREFDLFRAELALFARQESAAALEAFLARLQPTQNALQERTTMELRAQFAQWHLRLPPLLDAWRDWLDAFLRHELAEVSRAQRPLFCAPVQRTCTHLTRTLQAFYDRLADHVQSALGVTLAPRDFALEVREPDAPPVRIAFAFDAAFATVGWLIPLTLFRRPIERALLRKARYEVEKNLSRLAADWRDRVTVVIEELRQQTEQAARSELDSLENLLVQTASTVPRLREQIAALETTAGDSFTLPQS